MKKRKGPWWWRRRVSCPECGYIYHDNTPDERLTGNPLVVCPRCHISLDRDEFWKLNHSKYDRRAEV